MRMMSLALLCCSSIAAPAASSADLCIGCQIIGGLAGEGALKQIEKALDQYCKDSTVCKDLVKLLLDLIASGEAPDKACKQVKLCDGTCILYSQWPVAHLPPKPPAWPTAESITIRDNEAFSGNDIADALLTVSSWLTSSAGADRHRQVLQHKVASTLGLNPCGTNITCNLHRFTDQHLPLEDLDGDGFGNSGNGTLRNWHWRGRDCAPAHDDQYPGRKQYAGADASVDYNCNGILGGNATGSYEDIFCKDSQPRGLILLGDSATAHFHIPPQWMTAQGWSADMVFSSASALAAEDELDWPQCSWGTGFENATSCPYPFGFTKVESLASRLRERNLCNHRDYQNIGVNGARMTASMQLAESMERSNTLDHPATVLLSLIGNDVCNGHPGSDHMTTPADFETHVRATLKVVDAKLPKDSYVVAIGLVDGRVLWNNMHALQHPTGTSYEDVYSFLSCTGQNPCWGWLNSNETWRNFTSERAFSLNAVYEKLAQEQASGTTVWKNFKFVYHAVDWPGFIAEYVKSGGKASDLIEPVDGFHPSQAGNMYMSEQVWKWMETNIPDALGPINPHNEEIRSLFGGQGGY